MQNKNSIFCKINIYNLSLILKPNLDYIVIAEHVNVSNRTVRNDIHVINSNFMDDIIVSIKSKGYQLNTSQYTLETITERYTHIQSYKENYYYLWRINC